MVTKIIFFNHFHRGDLFTHKEFIKQIKEALPHIQYEYWHYNHPKVILDLQIPLTSLPKVTLDNAFYQSDDALIINTWIGAYAHIMHEFNGINLHSLTKSWETIFNKVNEYFGTSLLIRSDITSYLPRVDYSFFNVKNIDEFIKLTQNRKKVLLCNGTPLSGQSGLMSNLGVEVDEFAQKHTEIDFICTSKFISNKPNVYFTDDIIKDTEEYDYKAPWNDRPLNTCDLNEISYLSTKCSLIIGKSSGPSTFCETYDNIMDSRKSFVSFSIGQHAMSYAIPHRCKYTIVSDAQPQTVKHIIERELDEVKTKAGIC